MLKTFRLTPVTGEEMFTDPTLSAENVLRLDGRTYRVETCEGLDANGFHSCSCSICAEHRDPDY